jgi:hypothetical protein
MKIPLFIAACTLLVVGAQAQQIVGDTTFVSVSIRKAIDQYNKKLDGQQFYFNGGAYVEPQRTGETHPFFETDEWQHGSIVFDHEPYENLLLLYDVMSDKLVTETIHGNLMALNSEKINSFTINNHHFVFLKSNETKKGLPRAGFYEVLYDGAAKVFALHTKSRQEEVEITDYRIRFDEKHRYYILKSGKYYPVKNKRSVLKVFAEQRHSLKSLMKKNGVDFNENREQAIASIARLYDSLISGR